jgi:hypothetical protein
VKIEIVEKYEKTVDKKSMLKVDGPLRHQKIIAWSNRPRIHTLPAPQMSSELAYCSSICGMRAGDRANEYSC